MNSDITLEAEGLKFPAYLSSPEGTNLPAILLIHEVWGLSPQIKSVADRLSAQGFVVLAPDLITHTGITEKINPELLKQAMDPATRDEAQKKIRAAWAPLNMPEFGKETVGRTRHCFDHLANLPNVDPGRISVIGFCFGGTYTFSLAVNEPKLHSAVAFYGHAPESEEELAKIKCSVLAFYGEKDENLIKDLPKLVERMDKLEKDFESVVYPNCGHAFFNDSNPNTYNKQAAEDAWIKLLDFLGK